MPSLTEEQKIGRAKNALLSFFEQRLSVPKIYLDADWEEERVDVLAIDRAGAGDVSIALIYRDPGHTIDQFKKLYSLPAHFKYWVVNVGGSRSMISDQSEDDVKMLESRLSKDPGFFAPDGVGRIGYIIVDFRPERPNISVPIPAERFRSNQHIYDLADTFATSHIADFEVRL